MVTWATLPPYGHVKLILGSHLVPLLEIETVLPHLNSTKLSQHTRFEEIPIHLTPHDRTVNNLHLLAKPKDFTILKTI